jgi:hypothetical protein
MGMVCAFGFAVFSVIPVQTARAKTIQLGGLRVIPALDYSGSYRQNIFLVNGDTEGVDEEEDFVHTVTPSITLEKYFSEGNYIRFAYGLDLVAYNDFQDNNFQSHNPTLNIGMKKRPTGFYFTVNNSFIDTADPYGTEFLYNEGQKTNRWSNVFAATLGYDFTRKYGVEFSYQNTLIRFDDDYDKWQNRIDHTVGGAVVYHATPKISVLGELRQTWADYDEQTDYFLRNEQFPGWTDSNSRDYITRDYLVGVRFVPGGRMLGSIKFGWGEREFENEIDPFGNPYKDQDSWIAETNFAYQPRKRTSINLKIYRSFRGSPETRTVSLDSQDENAVPIENLTAGSSAYTKTSTRLGVTQGIGKKLNADAFVEWIRADYDNEYYEPEFGEGTPDIYFDHYNLGASLKYPFFSWFTGGLGYEYRVKVAGEDEYEDEEYKDNIFSVLANIYF